MRGILKATIASLAMVAAAPVMAQTATLSTGTNDGQVTVAVNGAGAIGSSQGSYNPVGPGAAASTIFSSGLFYRIGGTGNRIALSNASASTPIGSGTAVSSTFTSGILTGTLNQSVSNTFQNGAQTGSLLTQVYNFTNTSALAITLDLVRYLDGDLSFDGSIADGGGRLVAPNGSPLLFEIDSATGASTATTFVGIYNQGGTNNGFQISGYNTTPTLNVIGGSAALNNGIVGDNNNNGFIDAGAGYDVTLMLGNLLDIGAGATATFTTYTLFGSGAPDEVVVPGEPTPAVPEPASWAMMIMGLGVVGGSLRRRRRGSTAAVAA
jgi:hypothetical protein